MIRTVLVSYLCKIHPHPEPAITSPCYNIVQCHVSTKRVTNMHFCCLITFLSSLTSGACYFLWYFPVSKLNVISVLQATLIEMLLDLVSYLARWKADPSFLMVLLKISTIYDDRSRLQFNLDNQARCSLTGRNVIYLRRKHICHTYKVGIHSLEATHQIYLLAHFRWLDWTLEIPQFYGSVYSFTLFREYFWIIQWLKVVGEEQAELGGGH